VYKTLHDFDRREKCGKIEKSNLEVVPVKKLNIIYIIILYGIAE